MKPNPDPNDLDAFFSPNRWQDPAYAAGLSADPLHEAGQRLGVVVGGSLSKGLVIKLDREVNVEELAVGRYVVVHGQRARFFCMVSDIRLESTNPAIQSEPPDMANPFIRAVYDGTVAYSLVTITPMLMIDESEGAPRALPVKTIPRHFALAHNASAEDVNHVFGKDDDKHFYIGSPLELQETKIHLNMKRLAERSVGVFGKSGTGKSFLTKILLAGLLRSRVGVTLIFDMHNDYGWEVTSENGTSVKGLGQLFSDRVTIFTLDGESSRQRRAKYQAEITIATSEIEPQDLESLKLTLNLSDTMIDAAYTLSRHWGDEWIARLLDATEDDQAYISENTNIPIGSFGGLQRRLERFGRWHFITREKKEDSAQLIIDKLMSGQSVVLEFGKYGNSLEAYMLVANYLTRRIHAEYVRRVEVSLGDKAQQPPQLMITIEEAHKFLDPQVARQTTFGIIAREMRKYNVTLLIVDQRPSMIDEEVMSQVGTRVTALLDNERDISAVLNGVSGAAGLREILARLETKQQAIIMGHAVPMPVVIRPRNYDADFYAALSGAPIPASDQVADPQTINRALTGNRPKRLG